MKPKILITGPPKCGKSTLIDKLISYFKKKEIEIHGFITPEVRENQKRIGFDIRNIYSVKDYKLARKGNYDTKYNLGSYSVFINEFEQMLDDFQKEEKSEEDLIIIDEIGKMELFSHKFQILIKELFSSSFPIIATIGLNLKHDLKEELLKKTEVLLLRLNRNNQEKVFKKIVNLDIF
jgi:nucleoside-triphosphatase THEP1